MRQKFKAIKDIDWFERVQRQGDWINFELIVGANKRERGIIAKMDGWDVVDF